MTTTKVYIDKGGSYKITIPKPIAHILRLQHASLISWDVEARDGVMIAIFGLDGGPQHPDDPGRTVIRTTADGMEAARA